MEVKPTSGEGLSLVGFRINPNNEDPEIFTLIIYDGQDSPLMVDGQIVFFSKPELVSKAYDLCTDDLKALGSPPTDVDLVCDIAETLHIINHQNGDSASIVLNCLNTIFDLVQAANTNMPEEYKTILYGLADHLTFNHEFSDFLQQHSIDRETIINATLWCIGAVAVKSMILE